mmetsp:Transcript_9354/g.18432  ORF Transcript_9354/g.18432 Transcript_9354/m.18432 type:complete len:384 (-) Transcript_9354:39-1190(-)
MAAFGGGSSSTRKLGRPTTNLSFSDPSMTKAPPSYLASTRAPTKQHPRQPDSSRTGTGHLLMPVDLGIDMSLGQTRDAPLRRPRTAAPAQSAPRRQPSNRTSVALSSRMPVAPQPLVPRRPPFRGNAETPRGETGNAVHHGNGAAEPRLQVPSLSNESTSHPKRPSWPRNNAKVTMKLGNKLSEPLQPNTTTLSGSSPSEHGSSLTSLGRSRSSALKLPPPQPAATGTISGLRVSVAQRNPVTDDDDDGEVILIQKSSTTAPSNKPAVTGEPGQSVISQSAESSEHVGSVFASDYLHGAGGARRKLGLSSHTSSSLGSPLPIAFIGRDVPSEEGAHDFSRLFWSDSEATKEGAVEQQDMNEENFEDGFDECALFKTLGLAGAL